jgi:hypothetical protein
LKIWYEKQCYYWEPRTQLMENGLQIDMDLIELTKFYPEMHICLRSWTVSTSQWLSTVSISRSIFPACGMTDIEQPMICIRLYREGGRYVESANKKRIQKKEKKNTKKEREKEKRIKKRKKGKRIKKEREKEKEKTHVQ